MIELRSITSVPVTCRLCEWTGVTGDCLPGDDGELLCGKCASYDLEIHHLPHEVAHQAGVSDA
jgi:hypothetical protein